MYNCAYTYKSKHICTEDRITDFFGAKFQDEVKQISTVFLFAVISEEEKKGNDWSKLRCFDYTIHRTGSIKIA